MLTDAEKTDARRFLGYPATGGAQPGAAGLIEHKLNNLAVSEESVLRQQLAALNELEQAIPGASASLDTLSAGGWVRNPAEVADRLRLLNDWSRRLCAFLGVPPGPAFGSGNSVNLVV